jgi:Flp pilus assembly protein TadB
MKRDENLILFGIAGLIISYILYVYDRILLSALAFTATVVIGLIWGAMQLRKKNER